MTKEELAQKLNNREYGEEITDAEEKAAKQAGLVVLFGYSDDNAEFRGAINDEVGAYEGTEIYVTRSAVLGEHEDCECDFCGFKAAKAKAAMVKAVWGGADYSWAYNTKIPHAKFDVLEDGTKFCRGIVFSVNDLPQ